MIDLVNTNGTDEAVAATDIGEEIYTDDPADEDILSESEETVESDLDSYEVADTVAEDAVDYEQLMAEDLDTLKRSFPELRGVNSITGLANPMRYAELRDLGLSASEAYLATAGATRGTDTRSHLSSSVPRRAHAPAGMSRSELQAARALFSDMTDAEIQRLYNRVKD